MSKAAELANLIGNINAGGGGVNRNVLINSAMNVAQRATSATGKGDADGYFVCDRWNINIGATSAGRFTLSQDSSAPSGFANSLKFDCTTADTSIAAGENMILQQKIEGQNVQSFAKGTSDAKPFALSFYVKGNASATYVAALYDGDNNRVVASTFSVTTDWARVEITFPADTTGALDDDNASSLELWIVLHAGSNFTSGTLASTWASYDATTVAAGGGSFFDSTDRTFFITGVQLEVGQNPTEFETEPFERTLLKCSRYFQQVTTGENNGPIALATAYNSAQLSVPIPLRPEMRATPTVDIDTGSNYYRFTSNASNTNFDDIAFDIGTRQAVIVAKGSLSGMTGGQAGYFFTKSTSARLAFNAEL